MHTLTGYATEIAPVLAKVLLNMKRFFVFTLILFVALLSVMLPTHTNATSDSKDGWDPALPGWGSAAVWGFTIYSTHVETSHSVSFEHMSPDDDITCHWAFQTEIREQPQFTTRSEGTGEAPRMDENGWITPFSYSTINYIWIENLAPGFYTLGAYSRLDAAAVSIKALASTTFEHE